MAPKEKAQDLVDKYSFVEIANYTSMFEVKQCALIAVDEYLLWSNNDNIQYWQQVKQEIRKL